MITTWFKQMLKEAGVPVQAEPEAAENGLEFFSDPKTRPETLPIRVERFTCQIEAFGKLPKDRALQKELKQVIADPNFLRSPPDALKTLLQMYPKYMNQKGDLATFLKLMHSEITRQMYLDSAKMREGALGIRFLAKRDTPLAPQEKVLVTEDLYGMGAGAYPFNDLPEEPCLGCLPGYFLRVIVDD